MRNLQNGIFQLVAQAPYVLLFELQVVVRKLYGFPIPTMPGTFSVPERLPPICSPPLDVSG
ncbi:hypothetical protein NNO_0069 [Hydrogenimonas sp.]|nr:hypothetical protein NNO_0069 [Hydrogenimonas sp.]